MLALRSRRTGDDATWRTAVEQGGGRKGERKGEERGDEGGEREERGISSVYSLHLHIPLYTFIYLHISRNTFKYLYILSYTPIYLKILNIKNMRANMRSKNGHNSSPRASPRVRI